MTNLDWLYAFVLAIAFLLDGFVLWPSFVRRSTDNPARARLWIWSWWMGMLWGLVAVGAALWLAQGRTWESLGLTIAHGWRTWIALGLFAALAIAYGRTIAKLARATNAQLAGLRSHFGDLAVVLPQTRTELRRFVALSLTAGFCEEFIFRGYLIWFFSPLLGLWGAAAISTLLFAAAHAYQGVGSVVKTGILGAAMMLMVLAFHSLWPAIAIHALVDIGSGVTALLILRGTATGNDIVDGASKGA